MIGRDRLRMMRETKGEVSASPFLCAVRATPNGDYLDECLFYNQNRFQRRLSAARLTTLLRFAESCLKF
ncbi:hypothetical protein D8666_14345 [Ochrobactrum soli]|uniref:Uncharacterized protein n=1 Tax=Ochrobactrum soli TaxID=2448455 RepID=A0A2P9HFI1_9HYPH|nr:hypothetical protein D8666_14345 [[Ochrobactrum] soli]SPL62841.1 hypothetical protein OHAE_2773 [[Ochrobactrum] soli]